MHTISRLGTLLVTAVVGLTLSPAPQAAAQTYDGTAPQPGYGVTGAVYATAVSGDTLFVGGTFLKVVTTANQKIDRPYLAAFSLSTGQLLTSWAGRVNGAVRALAVHENSLYVGGTFLNASDDDDLSQQRMRMAKFDVETGDLDSTFHPNFSGGVKAIAIEGLDVYVGGGFGTVTGTKHKNVVKLNAETGAVSAAFQGATNKAVWCLVKSPLNDTLWVGGLFETVDGVPRLGIGGLAGDTGALVGPEFGHMEPPVYGIDINSDGSMLFAAQKSNQGGGWRVSDGDRRWVARMDGNAQAAKYFDGNVYFGFHDGYQGDASVKLLSVNPDTGVVDPSFRPVFDRFMGVHTIDVAADQLVIGGQWNVISGLARKNIAVFTP